MSSTCAPKGADNNSAACHTPRQRQFLRNERLRASSFEFLALLLGLAASCWGLAPYASADEPTPDGKHATVLAIRGARFTVNGTPTFLLGISYYGGLGAPQDFVRRDLDDAQRLGFNWVRLFATWRSGGEDVSAVDDQGKPREPFFGRLQSLVADCDRRGLVVDVTLARGKGPGHLHDLAAHQRAVEAIVTALKGHRDWYLDLANEHDVGDDRNVPTEQLGTLRDLVRRLDPDRLVTASFGGHDLDENDIRDALLIARLDFLAPHRPRDPASPAQTEAQTRRCIAIMERIGRVVPVHYQEPLRRGYTRWEPKSADFLTDLRGAIAGGAAGWCFHNGSQRDAPGHRPTRSFDLHEKRLFDQLDPDEQKVVSSVATQRPEPR